MGITEIFKKLFRRKAKTVVLETKHQNPNNYSPSLYADEDKSIFEIVHAVPMSRNQIIISGKIKRGVFRTGSRIALYNPIGTVRKAEAIILNIKTALVEVNRLCGGEAEFLIETSGDCLEIEVGDRVYKIQEELKNVIQ